MHYYYFVLTKFFTSEAVNGVIVHHADSLHKGVADCRAGKLEASFFQLLAHSIRLMAGGRDFLQSFPGILDGLTPDK